MTVRTTAPGDLPRESIGQPSAVILPEPVLLFTRRAERLRVLAVAHPMGEWLRFLALIADAQKQACDAIGPEAAVVLATAGSPVVSWPGRARRPATSGGDAGTDADDTLEPTVAPSVGRSFDIIIAHIAAIAGDGSIPDACRTVLSNLVTLDTRVLAEAWLTGTMPATYAGEAVPIAAALQVWFTREAAALDVSRVHLLPQRGLCPVCGSDPVAGVITASGKAPGARYLHCGLCATAWNHVRACCIGCGESKGLALQEVEGGTGSVRAETCDTCHGYAKMLYEAKDMAIEPLADDLASLGLDLMVSDAGWSRLAPNPMVAVSG